MKLKKILVQLISAIIDSIRPMLGPRGVCIYPITCRQYAKTTLQQKPLYIAIPLITLRVLSCNPAVALFIRWRERRRRKLRNSSNSDLR